MENLQYKRIILKLQFDAKLFVYLFIAFIFATVFGTISHECGHYFVAEYLGHDANLHHASTSIRFSSVYFYSPTTDRFLSIVSGPLQTMLTGSLGLVLLCVYRKSYALSTELKLWQWVLIFLALFWTRASANFMIWLGNIIFTPDYISYLDEVKIAEYLQIPEITIISFTALIGFVVLAVVIFKFVPLKQRWTFIVSGFFGGISGYYLWIKLLGKHIIS